MNDVEHFLEQEYLLGRTQTRANQHAIVVPRTQTIRDGGFGVRRTDQASVEVVAESAHPFQLRVNECANDSRTEATDGCWVNERGVES